MSHRKKKGLVADFEARSVALIAACVLAPLGAASQAPHPASASLRSTSSERPGFSAPAARREAAALPLATRR